MRPWLALACALVAGCEGRSGGAEESNEFCHTIRNDAITCSGCTQVTNSGEAFDGRMATAASIGPGGQGSFLGTSSNQPAGSIAGVYFTLTDPAGVSITITTFLDGAEQETSAGPATRQNAVDTCNLGMNCSFNDGEGSWVGMNTNEPYDAIQATISNSSSGTLQVNELCVR